jgi:Na+/H+ antiporter NhaD/arsenite permease-like protein
VAAGLACLVVALPSVIRARSAFRLGSALVVLLSAGLLLRSGFSGTPPALEALVGGAALVALAAVVATLARTAAASAGERARGDAIERRRPPA